MFACAAPRRSQRCEMACLKKCAFCLRRPQGENNRFLSECSESDHRWASTKVTATSLSSMMQTPTITQAGNRADRSRKSAPDRTSQPRRKVLERARLAALTRQLHRRLETACELMQSCANTQGSIVSCSTCPPRCDVRCVAWYIFVTNRLCRVPMCSYR